MTYFIHSTLTDVDAEAPAAGVRVSRMHSVTTAAADDGTFKIKAAVWQPETTQMGQLCIIKADGLTIGD